MTKWDAKDYANNSGAPIDQTLGALFFGKILVPKQQPGVLVARLGDLRTTDQFLE